MSNDPAAAESTVPPGHDRSGLRPSSPVLFDLGRLWRYGRALLAPVLIWVLLVWVLREPVRDWLRSEEAYDRAAVEEWLLEARNADSTLAELAAEYVRRVERLGHLSRQLEAARQAGDEEAEAQLLERTLTARIRMAVRREEIYQHLRALAEPATKMYPGQLPLFPVIYRLEVHLDLTSPLPAQDDGPPVDVVIWDSGLEPQSGPSRDTEFSLGPAGRVKVHYQLRAWNRRQRDEAVKTRRLRQLGLLAVAATGIGAAWLMLLQADEREAQRQKLLARERIDQAERQRLEEERRRVETERELLEQRLATQAAERRALEMKSQLYASIGIMAGSYAHNIKNLLVRPNDLLRRCLERPGVASEEERMLREVQQTLGTVTERLQQILNTVRRDPSRSELRRLDVNAVVRGLAQTWTELAADRWQLDLKVEPGEGALWVEADDSHLYQALENLLFNARDATFEMRNHLRDEARRATAQEGAARRQALIAAAGWRGQVVIRTGWEETGQGRMVVVEMTDNGVGMTEEVRRRCTETHFSTKRDNALYEGYSTGMGLGLSFVVSILENHRASLEIASRPLGGTAFRVRFPEAT